MTRNLRYSCRIFAATVLLLIFFVASSSSVLNYFFFTLVLFFFRKDADLLNEIKKPLSFKKALAFVPLFLVFSFILSALFPVNISPEKTTLNVLFITLLGPLYEEIFFRKLLTKGLGRFSAPLVSSLIFGVFHGLYGFPSAFFAGLVLYLIYKLSGGIKLPFLAHFLNNVLALIFN